MNTNEPLDPPPSAETLRRQFLNPAREYGPIDCWWWEAGQLDKERMRWQLEEMNAKGVAGTWFYPRFVGDEPLSSDPGYWTQKWWDFTRFSMEEHRRLGMVAWLNDWTARQFFQDRLRAEREENPSLAGRRLALHTQESKAPGLITVDIPADEEVLHAAAYRKTVDGRLQDSSSEDPAFEDLGAAVKDHRLTWEASEAGWLVAVVTGQPHDLDYLHPSVADRWLGMLLGAYDEELGDFIGETLQAHGTDEVFVLNGSTLYSPALFDRFKTEKGYDPAPHLIGLFHDIGPMTDKIRCDYYDLMASMVEENLYAPLSRGLEKRGLLYTEFCPNGKSEDMLSQTYNYGDFFRYMSHYSIPGNEENSRRTRTFQAKMASSIADLYGHKRVGGCVFWGTGWGHTTEQNLTWTHENYALGVNLYNRHGVLYSTMGGWYEWVPPEIHFRQPYWQYWKHFTDYVTRLSYILSQGIHQPDVALLYPLTTIHAHWPAGRMSEEGTRVKFNHPEDFDAAAHEAAKTSYVVAKRIYKSGIDLDFIDDRSLCSGEVGEGQLRLAGMAFRAVVLPQMTTIRTQTLEHIKAFYDSGGTVVAYHRLPDASPEQGRDDPNIQRLLRQIFGIAASDAVTGPVQQENEHGGKGIFLPPDADVSMLPGFLSEAIDQDVVASQEDVYHTHKRIGDVDVYFLFNAMNEKWDLTLSMRASGEPEVWNAFTGETEILHRFQTGDDGRTTVRLDMDPNEGVLLVVGPASGRPQILEDNLTAVTSLEALSGSLEVRGLCDSGGKKHLRVLHQGQTRSAHLIADEPRVPLVLDGRWKVRLEPTMDNRWGDFRYPASKTVIGPEARRFRYMEEEAGIAGTELGWHRPELDDSHWQQVTYSYGPYWWTIGPFGEQEPEEILQRALAGEISTGRWQQYSFSQKFGHEGKETHNMLGGGLRGVSDRFIVFDPGDEDLDATRYLFTHVHSPQEEDYLLDVGGTAAFSRDAWVNGEQVLSVDSRETKAQAVVHLTAGWNTLLLKLVQPKGERLATYAVLHERCAISPSNPKVPLLSWFVEPHRLLYDITPEKHSRVGWYRFPAPPGLSSMSLNLRAEAVTAWIDGEPVDVDTEPDGSEPAGKERIILKSPRKDPCQIALRVEQKPGCYAGAAFSLPVAFTCEEGSLPLGDWCEHGLATYSGGTVYTTEVTLEEKPRAGKVVLDLGRVATTAEVHVNGKPAGVGMATPYRFDVTQLVGEGPNQIQVKVVNSLANHMSTYPTKYVLEGQTVSGLLGPVELQFLSEAVFRIEN